MIKAVYQVDLNLLGVRFEDAERVSYQAEYDGRSTSEQANRKIELEGLDNVF